MFVFFDVGGPFLVYLFLVLCGAAALFSVMRRMSDRERRNSTSMSSGIVHAALFILNLVFWHTGVRFLGPVRASLLDHLDVTIVPIWTALRRWKSTPSPKRGGALLLMIVLFVVSSMGAPPMPNNHQGEINPAAEVAVEPTPTPTLQSASSVSLFFFDVPMGLIGGVSMVLAGLMAIMRRTQSQKLEEVGGPLQLQTKTSTTGAAILSVPALIQLLFWLNERELGHTMGVSFFALLASSFASTLFVVIVNHVNDSISSKTQPDMAPLRFSLIAYGATGLAFSLVRADSMSFTTGLFTALCFFVSLAGLRLLLGKSGGASSDLRLVYAEVAARGVAAKQWRTLSDTLRHIITKRESRSIFFYLIINLAFMFVEFIVGLWTNSLGLITDSAHMLFDCIALAIGLYAAVMSTWKPTTTHTYGYQRYEVIAGFANGMFLVIVALLVLTEGILRLFSPPTVLTERLLFVSVAGFLVNLVGLFAFSDVHLGHSHGHSHDHHHDVESHEPHVHGHGNDNMKAIFLHVMADTLGSVGVIVSSLLIEYFGLMIADPICSIIIAVLIFMSVQSLLKQSASTLLQRVPHEFGHALHHLLTKVTAVDGVLGYREPHFWLLANSEMVGTIHVQAREDCSEQYIVKQVSGIFSHEVQHMAVQVEKDAFFASVVEMQAQGQVVGRFLDDVSEGEVEEVTVEEPMFSLKVHNV